MVRIPSLHLFLQPISNLRWNHGFHMFGTPSLTWKNTWHSHRSYKIQRHGWTSLSHEERKSWKPGVPTSPINQLITFLTLDLSQHAPTWSPCCLGVCTKPRNHLIAEPWQRPGGQIAVYLTYFQCFECVINLTYLECGYVIRQCRTDDYTTQISIFFF